MNTPQCFNNWCCHSRYLVLRRIVRKKREPVNPVPAFFFRVKSGRKFWKSIFVLKKKVLASFWLFGKNTDNSEKILRKSGKYYWEEYVNFGKRKDKIRSSLHFDRKTQKNTWNSKTYTGNSEKITQFWKTQKKYRKSGKIPRKTRKNISETLRKQGPHLILIEESGKILIIWKKYSRHIWKKSLEKYYWKLGKIFRFPEAKSLFQLCWEGTLSESTNC